MKTHIDIVVGSGFCFYGALLLLMLPIRWIAGGILAVAVHEFGHLLALTGLSVPISGISVTANGVKIHSSGMSLWKELIASIAGPIGGMLVILLLPVFPEAAVCACVHTVFNMIPVYPFDGGRTVCAVCRLLFGDITGQKIVKAIQILSFLLVLFLSVAAVRYVGVASFLPVFLVLKGANILPLKRYCLDK